MQPYSTFNGIKNAVEKLHKDEDENFQNQPIKYVLTV